MTSKGILAKQKAAALTSMAADLHETKENYNAMMQWMADYMVVTHELLIAIKEVVDSANLPPLDGDEGEGTPPTSEPKKPKRGRPKKGK